MSTSTTKEKTAILLVNLGSPDSTSVPDVRRYLREFLMDEYVIDVAYPLRWFIINCFILPFRPKKSAEAYSKIWWEEGSPLIEYSKQLSTALQKKVSEPVFLAMRYGNPSMESIINQIETEHPDINHVKLIPLYPHFAMASTKTVIEKAKSLLKKRKSSLKLSILKSFFDKDVYINALAKTIEPYLKSNYDMLLFSYHGIPERHLRKADCTGEHCLKVNDCCHVASPAHEECYRHQAVVTTELVTKKLGLKKEQWSLSFQSRLGRDPWLKPYTDFELERFAEEGIKRLGIICPAFVSDCLETLEEIEMEGKETFLEAGGEFYEMIPCMNIQDVWVEALATLCNELK